MKKALSVVLTVNGKLVELKAPKVELGKELTERLKEPGDAVYMNVVVSVAGK